jgi:hypothetical protein
MQFSNAATFQNHLKVTIIISAFLKASIFKFFISFDNGRTQDQNNKNWRLVFGNSAALKFVLSERHTF